MCAEVLTPGESVGRYRIDSLLGRGGMGTVYEATDVDMSRRVALKLLSAELASDPEFVARFRREGRVQAALEHPHVVAVYEPGESERGIYLAMQLIRGPTLAEILADGELDSARALRLMRQVAAALDAAHAAGLVHRDVKPRNVLVGSDDHAYLADFGLTKLGGSSTGVTVTGEVLGTLAYLAPEVIRGEPATPASDRYAFAAMLFECLSGSVVFPRPTPAAMLYAHTSDPPPQISRRRPELPAALDDVLIGALAKDPGRRPRSATAIVDSAEAALAGRTLPAPTPPEGALPSGETAGRPVHAGGRGRGRRRRAALLVAGGALAGAALAGGLVAALDSGGRDTKSSVPPPLAGAQPLGSKLDQAGRTLDCRGRAPGPGSPGCTILQAALPGGTVVAPQDGVIRRWAVRSASGEVALVVIRPREGKFFAVARSRNEFVTDPGVHLFAADIAVDRNDLIGIDLLPGSGVGTVAGARGTTTNRWLPRMFSRRSPDLAAGTGFDHELLLRADYVPGGHQRIPAQVKGAEAAALPAGTVIARRPMRFADRLPAEAVLVVRSGRFGLDFVVRGKRVDSIAVPSDFRPGGGRLLTFDVVPDSGEREASFIDIEYVNEGSQRILDHGFDANDRQFDFIN
jgi:hypothetical protein